MSLSINLHSIIAAELSVIINLYYCCLFVDIK